MTYTPEYLFITYSEPSMPSAGK